MPTKQIIKAMLLLIVAISGYHKIYSQNIEESNPIVFGDFLLGGAFGSAGGFATGMGINYQVKSHLFTARITGTVKFKADIISPWLPLPLITASNTLTEAGVLYGYRFVEEGHSFSISLGVSHNKYTESYSDDGLYYETSDSYMGVPFEANIKWFKKRKERFRIYGLIPVGNPTAFGGSIGFKIFGSLSKRSYGGLGITYGLGTHREY